MRHSITDLQCPVLCPSSPRDRRAQHADPLTAERDERSWIRRVGAHSAHELLRRTSEVELAFAWLELRRECHFFGVLRLPHQLSGEVARHLALEQLAAEPRESRLELALRLVADLCSRLREDRSGIELRGPLHQRDAGLGISGEDRVGDRSRAAPPREERRVHVERTAADRGEERLRDLVPVRRPDEKLGPKREDRGGLSLIQPGGLPDREAHRSRSHLHRGLAHHTTRCGAIGLRNDPDDLNDPALAQAVECLERANRELRSPEEKSALC